VKIAFMFDSTHFPSGQPVEVRFVATDTDGDTTSASISPVAKNKASVFGRYDLEVSQLTWIFTRPPDPSQGEYLFGDDSWAGTSAAAAKLAAMNDAVFGPETGLGWPALGFLAMVEAATVVYVNTHGGPMGNAGTGATTAFESDAMDFWFWYDSAPPNSHPNYAEDFVTGSFENHLMRQYKPILPRRVAANGSGLPPFNTGEPPINLAFVDGCECGLGPSQGYVQEFSGAFLYPGGNWYEGIGSYPEDQSYCSYLIDVDIDRTKAVVQVFFSSLRDGYTVHQARIFAYDDAYAGAHDDPGSAFEWMVVYGDWHTRLHGVYTGVSDVFSDGSPVPITQWFRQIPHP
jgi:hypothetical protein